MERQKALELAIQQIERQFGKGSIMKLGKSAALNISVIPSACLELASALGTGGFPRAG